MIKTIFLLVVIFAIADCQDKLTSTTKSYSKDMCNPILMRRLANPLSVIPDE
jgi:hypothetical protein